jgi:hypothetical protein
VTRPDAPPRLSVGDPSPAPESPRGDRDTQRRLPRPPYRTAQAPASPRRPLSQDAGLRPRPGHAHVTPRPRPLSCPGARPPGVSVHLSAPAWGHHGDPPRSHLSLGPSSSSHACLCLRFLMCTIRLPCAGKQRGNLERVCALGRLSTNRPQRGARSGCDHPPLIPRLSELQFPTAQNGLTIQINVHPNEHLFGGGGKREREVRRERERERERQRDTETES